MCTKLSLLQHFAWFASRWGHGTKMQRGGLVLSAGPLGEVSSAAVAASMQPRVTFLVLLRSNDDVTKRRTLNGLRAKIVRLAKVANQRTTTSSSFGACLNIARTRSNCVFPFFFFHLVPALQVFLMDPTALPSSSQREQVEQIKTQSAAQLGSSIHHGGPL